MPTTNLDQSIAIVRTLLTEEFDTYRHLDAKLDRSAYKIFAAVMGAAFVEAATRRFGEQPDKAEIVQFVAETRATYATVGEKVAAEDAEYMIRAALGEDHLMNSLDGRAMGLAQAAMLFALVREGNYTPSQIDDLLDLAGQRASSYFQRNAQ